MIIETKEFKKEVYIAFDGTEFFEELQCRMYEGSSFGVVLERLNDRILKSGIQKELFGFGSDETKCYSIVPKTRNDIYNLNQILNMGCNKPNDLAASSDIDNLIILNVTLKDNIVREAYILRAEKKCLEISRGRFTVVSTIKEDIIKEKDVIKK